jgi:hypothetical protein
MPSYTSASHAQIVPEGNYTFVVKNAKPGRSVKDPATETIELELSLDNGSGRCWDTLTFSEKAAFKIDEFREAIGETIVPGQVVDVDPNDLIGASGQAHVFVDTYNGKSKNKIANYLAPVVKPLPKAAAVKTNALNELDDSDSIPF